MEAATKAAFRFAHVRLDGILNFSDPGIQHLFILLQPHILPQNGIPSEQVCGCVFADGIDFPQRCGGRFGTICVRRRILLHQLPKICLGSHECVNFRLIAFQRKGKEPPAIGQNCQIPAVCPGHCQIVNALRVILHRELHAVKLFQV